MNDLTTVYLRHATQFQPVASGMGKSKYRAKLFVAAAQRTGRTDRNSLTPVLSNMYTHIEQGAGDLFFCFYGLKASVWKDAQELRMQPLPWLGGYDLPPAQNTDSWFLAVARFIDQEKWAHALATLTLMIDELDWSVEAIMDSVAANYEQYVKEAS